MNKKDFRFCIDESRIEQQNVIDESRIEQQIAMPYKFLAFLLCLSIALVVVLCSCSRNFIYECIRAKDFSFNENGKF